MDESCTLYMLQTNTVNTVYVINPAATAIQMKPKDRSHCEREHINHMVWFF